MRIISKYFLTKFIKNFFIVLFSLEIFFVGIDLLQNYKDLTDSANLQILYVLYNAFFTLTLTLPLSLVFAWILTLILLVKSNELVAALSLGVSYRKILFPVVIVSGFFVVLLIALQTTPLAYSYDQKSKILDGKYFTSTKNDIFLKYNEYFVYFQKLHPFQKFAENVRIFKIKDDKDVVETIAAKKAYFQNNRWYIVDAKITKKPENITWKTSKLEVSYEKFLYTLEGFKPKILDNVYEEKSTLSIIDAFSALKLLNEQEINTDKIRASLYYELINKFFIFPLILLLFVFVSFNRRFFNVGKFTSLAIGGTLVIWGIFFMLHKFSKSGVLNPELAILLPMIIWYIGSFLIVKKRIG